MLYDPELIKENCGFGLIANIDGKPSHKVVRTAMIGLARMQHRGAILADGKTGDGCGLLMQMPRAFFEAVAKENDCRLSPNFAVGMIFFPQDETKISAFQTIIKEQLEEETLSICGWREVPINKNALGTIAAQSLPKIMQVFVNMPTGWKAKDMERRLFMARRKIEKRIDHEDFYICSLSNQVIVYKGLCIPQDLPLFYKDLSDLRLQSAICLFHQRFSTNTTPQWKLAQPFRYLAHNGEINTISGNRAWAKARAYKYKTPLIPDLADAIPFVNDKGSDSSSLDNIFEVFINGGMDIFRAMRLLIPPAWQHNPDLDGELKAFYSFNSMHMEPWDGPAGVVFSDGRYAACTLDRNGLRPARYVITYDRLITVASEVGVWDYTPDEVVEKGRVGAGELLVIDTAKGKFLHSCAIDEEIKNRHPYRTWMRQNVIRLKPYSELPDEEVLASTLAPERLKVHQKEFGFTLEELEYVLRVLGEEGQEAVGSMGDDAPFAIFSHQSRVIYDYFRQYFAQVTNPPIDPLREKHVMSLTTNMGREMSVFYETEGMSHRVRFDSPILLYSDMQQVLKLPHEHYTHALIDATYDINQDTLKDRLQKIAEEAVVKAREGAVILVLSDRNVDAQRTAIPAPFVLGLVQNRLSDENLRCDTNIIIETGSARDPHQFAVLLGLGATAVYPYLAYESLAYMVDQKILSLSIREVMMNFRNGIDKGLLKIMSKMGISTIASYRCSRLFEIIGLSDEIVTTCFKGMISRIGGATFADFDALLKKRHHETWTLQPPLQMGGLLKYKPQGEKHAYNPAVVELLQKSVSSGKKEDYKAYRDTVNARPPLVLRDLLKLKPLSSGPIPLADVESVEKLYPRFDSAAMSIGALSPEAHEALAIAMNRLGGHSNSGEGGEDPKRYGTEKRSKIKQIASGRFGVTPAYLMSAEVIQIKVAQGAKPGEGGQLPGGKVTPYIAHLRYSVPGATLISPPPHHDIYSIEDLAQLIFDLKQLNPKALISVKLVSLPGVGTIASGVAKTYADLITISGYDGGTGAAPLTSVKHAGSAWELGLVEAQQALVSNNLRSKIRLQIDGGLKTGLDVVKAAILGAESFGFGTAPMIALGCRYLRICHLNNCATGVATQDETLREHQFHGLPEKVMNYFRFIAEEVREIMADLGVKNFTDLIGRTDLLTMVDNPPHHVNVAALLEPPKGEKNYPCYQIEDNPPYDKGVLNRTILEKCTAALAEGNSIEAYFSITNVDRSVGASLSGEIARRYGDEGKEGQRFDLYFNGTAGESFGVWLTGSMYFTLTGDANDYVGKGMAGGRLVIRPFPGSAFKANEAVIMGNTCLYGATGGFLFASGQAGERFAVRNSGAITVVEGVADNGCEYMTGGVVCILGKTGNNFGAGMTGGFCYIFDVDDNFATRMNPELIEALSIEDLPTHQEYLRGLIEMHVEFTNSEVGESILASWEESLKKCLLIKPKASKITSLLGHGRRSVDTLKAVAQ